MTTTSDFVPQTAGFWPQGWWKLVELRIGIVPLPVYAILVALIAGFLFTDSLPKEVCTFIAILAVCGFTCAELGKRLPVLRHIGAGAIFATFWALTGQTPGMRFLAIHLTHEGSRGITLGRAVWRVFAVILSLLPFGLGYLAILGDPQRRAWADRMTGTEVCYDSVARATARARAGHAASAAEHPRAPGR